MCGYLSNSNRQVLGSCLQQGNCSAWQFPLLTQYQQEYFSSFSSLSDSLLWQEGLSPLAGKEQQGGFCSSSLSPLSSLTEPVGCCASLEFPHQGRKLLSDYRNPNLPQRWMVMEFKCHCSDMSPHKKNFMHAEVHRCAVSRQKENQGWGEHFDILGT